MSTKQQVRIFEKMVLHNYKRLWTRLEKENNYEFGMMYCAIHGFEKFKKQGENYLFIFNLTISLFFFNLTIFYPPPGVKQSPVQLILK